MLPHLGQGAAQSIEDAAALGALLRGVGKGGDGCGEEEERELASRLSLFSSVRRERVTAIQILSEVPNLDSDFARASAKWARYLPRHGFPEKRSDVYEFCMSYDVIEECKALLDRSSSSS